MLSQYSTILVDSCNLRYVAPAHTFQTWGANQSTGPLSTALASGNFSNVLHLERGGNVGIGTTVSRAKLQVQGSILAQSIIPLSCNTYDLGNTDFRWRDLYLSGNTIDLDGLRISQNIDGDLTVKDQTEALKKVIVSEVQIGATDPIILRKSATNALEFVSDTGSIHIGNEQLPSAFNVTTMNETLIMTDAGTTIVGTLTTSNLVVMGETTTLNTITSNTERFTVNNAGTGPALDVIQTGAQPIVRFIDDTVVAMLIADGGNVGINTTTPTARLDVNGDVKVSQSLTASSFIGSGASLTSLNASSITTGTLSNVRTTATVLANPDTIVLRDANRSFSISNITASGAISASTFTGSGASLTSLNATAITSGTLSNALTTATSLASPDTIVLRDANQSFSVSNITASGVVSASNVVGDLSGNANTATKLLNARTINGVPFDGTSDITIGGTGGGGTVTSDGAWASSTNSVAYTSCNVGIGTTLPLSRLHVQGDVRVVGNMHVIGDITLDSLSNVSRNRLQASPSRFIYNVSSSMQATFSGEIDGIFGIDPYTIEVHQNGYKLAYLSSMFNDYTVAYTNTTSNTVFDMTLNYPAAYGDIIDVTVWPTFFDQGAASNLFGAAYQQISLDVKGWDYDGSNLVTTANIGVGTTMPASRLHVDGDLQANQLKIGPSDPFVVRKGTGNTLEFVTEQSTPVSYSGNAATATKLLTARTINGVSFDGSENINISSGAFPQTSAGVSVDWQFSNIDGTFALLQSSNYGPFQGIVKLDRDGLIGLRVGNPSALLHIGVDTTKTNNMIHVQQYDGTSRLLVKNDGSVGINQGAPLGQLHIGADHLVVTTEGYVGIGLTNPAYSLQLLNDSAAKPSASWTVPSDERIKEDIVLADYDVCYSNIRALDLKRYKYRDDLDGLRETNAPDRRIVGWIAQEVETIFPKSVRTVPNMYGVPDLKMLNIDQIVATLYGAVRKIMDRLETLEGQAAQP